MSAEKTYLGIDIGRANIAFCVIDENKNVIDSFSIMNDGYRKQRNQMISEHNPVDTIDVIVDILGKTLAEYPYLSGICITGQMHGIVYTNRHGWPMSNLVTSSDRRALLKFDEENTYSDEIEKRSGKRIKTGYGFSTLFFDSLNSRVPSDAVSYCTIADCLAMTLTSTQIPELHPSNAQSLGFFDLEKCEFDKEALDRLGIDLKNLPSVTKNVKEMGRFNGIPVYTPIGDNQAIVLGASSGTENALIVNIGNDASVSYITEKIEEYNDGIETRPYFDGKYIVTGYCMSAGKTYSMLEGFFESFAKSAGYEWKNQYETMDKIALESLDKERTAIKFEMGASDSVCASISGIDENNFTPSDLVSGLLYSIADDLYSICEKTGALSKDKLILTGKCARKTPALVKIIEKVFGKDAIVSEKEEEASFGAALCALFASFEN